MNPPSSDFAAPSTALNHLVQSMMLLFSGHSQVHALLTLSISTMRAGWARRARQVLHAQKMDGYIDVCSTRWERLRVDGRDQNSGLGCVDQEVP